MSRYLKDNREVFTPTDILYAQELLNCKIDYRLKQKGFNILISDYEISGIINEEVREFDQNVQQRLSAQAKIEELLDIAWAALLGVISLEKQRENECEITKS